MAEAAPDEDKDYFEPAIIALRVEYVVEKSYAAVPLDIRKQAFNDTIEGLTPRKIILLGLMLRARQSNERDDEY